MNAIVNLTKLFKFKGGVHPPQHKLESTMQPIRPLPVPTRLVLPLRQHVGNIPKIRVAVGERVLKGQLLAEAEGNISAAVHAPTSGVISAIADSLIPHPSGLPDLCITLEADKARTAQACHQLDLVGAAPVQRRTRIGRPARCRIQTAQCRTWLAQAQGASRHR